MNENLNLLLMKSIMDLQDDLVVLFKGPKLILANNSFLEFFQASSLDDFSSYFEDFADCFVNHPNYFNKTKIPPNSSWISTMEKLEENERIVSLITPNFDPHAFIVTINADIEGFRVVKFTNITQVLLKKIMIDNAKFPLFASMEFKDISEIVKLLHVKSFQKDEVIVQEGSSGNSMYFIIEGKVLIYNEKVQIQLKEGDFFGEIALLKDIPRTATVKAIDGCKALELNSDDFQSFIKTKPDLIQEIEKVANSRQN